jgi:hypothetical protein
VSHLFDEEHDEAWGYERFITTIEQHAGISWEKAERDRSGPTSSCARSRSSRTSTEALPPSTPAPSSPHFARRSLTKEFQDAKDQLPDEYRPLMKELR